MCVCLHSYICVSICLCLSGGYRLGLALSYTLGKTSVTRFFSQFKCLSGSKSASWVREPGKKVDQQESRSLVSGAGVAHS